VSEVDQVWTLERILKGLRSSVGESETPNGWDIRILVSSIRLSAAEVEAATRLASIEELETSLKTLRASVGGLVEADSGEGHGECDLLTEKNPWSQRDEWPSNCSSRWIRSDTESTERLNQDGNGSETWLNHQQLIQISYFNRLSLRFRHWDCGREN
jgi:hypothetical protein